MQTVSVRIPEEDLAWLAGIQLAGASSPSDKIRALLADARRRADGSGDYVGCVSLLREQVRPLLEATQALEHDHQLHSAIVPLLAMQLPELMASLSAGVPAGDQAPAQARDLEARLTARAMRMLLGLLRLGVTQRTPAYDPAVLDAYIPEVLELAKLIQSARQAT
jgi:hypothetical protein